MIDWRDYIGKVTCGDCLELMKDLPDKCVDAVVTDPPYNIGFKYSSYPDSLSEEEYINMMNEFSQYHAAIISYPEESMKYLVPSMGVPNEVLIWCYNSNIGRQSRLINIYGLPVHFERVIQPYKNPDDIRINKLISNGSTGTPMYDWFDDIQLEKNVGVNKREYPHPCPVPLKLMERIIILTTEPTNIILDPFLGSGTTAIAAIRTGRQFIGFEIDPHYCEIAERRIRDELAQVKIPFEPISEPEQLTLEVNDANKNTVG